MDKYGILSLRVCTYYLRPIANATLPKLLSEKKIPKTTRNSEIRKAAPTKPDFCYMIIRTCSGVYGETLTYKRNTTIAAP